MYIGENGNRELLRSILLQIQKSKGGNSNILAVSDHTITLMNLVFVNCKKNWLFIYLP